MVRRVSRAPGAAGLLVGNGGIGQAARQPVGRGARASRRRRTVQPCRSSCRRRRGPYMRPFRHLPAPGGARPAIGVIAGKHVDMAVQHEMRPGFAPSNEATRLGISARGAINARRQGAAPASQSSRTPPPRAYRQEGSGSPCARGARGMTRAHRARHRSRPAAARVPRVASWCRPPQARSPAGRPLHGLPHRRAADRRFAWRNRMNAARSEPAAGPGGVRRAGHQLGGQRAGLDARIGIGTASISAWV